ncbi:MAG: trigger factor [Candidatus Binataceae bacterium]|nr:trigger factor [Candidatus Binataceae bacterium]
MNVNIENSSALRRKMTIEVEPAEINRELDRAYNELKRSVVLKGFRPGHAPRNLLERFFGDQVRGDVIQKLVKEYTGKALEENSLTPVVEPEIVTEETDLKQALKFSAVFDLKPELVVKDYQELKVQAPTIAVNEEEVDAELTRMRERRGVLKKVEGRTTVAENDFVVAAFEGFEDGKAINGTKIEDRLLKVTKDTLAHGLDEVLVGAEAGAEVRKSRSYPADYSEKEIAGKEVEWRATAKEIYTHVVPELDPEFAKDEGFDDLDALRAKVRESLEARAHSEANARARQGLLELIVERNPVELPESLVAREMRNVEHEIASAFESSGMAHDEAIAKARENADDIRKRAENRARSALIVDAIAAQENVATTDDEVADRIAQIVTYSGRARDRMAEHYSHEENRAGLKQVMTREKTLDQLLTRAQGDAANAPVIVPAESGVPPDSGTPPVDA